MLHRNIVTSSRRKRSKPVLFNYEDVQPKKKPKKSSESPDKANQPSKKARVEEKPTVKVVEAVAEEEKESPPSTPLNNMFDRYFTNEDEEDNTRHARVVMRSRHLTKYKKRLDSEVMKAMVDVAALWSSTSNETEAAAKAAIEEGKTEVVSPSESQEDKEDLEKKDESVDSETSPEEKVAKEAEVEAEKKEIKQIKVLLVNVSHFSYSVVCKL